MSVFGMLGLVLAILVISPLCYSMRSRQCLQYNSEETPLAWLEGDWFVQDYANAGSDFKNQTCIKFSFHLDSMRNNTATFNKTWIDKWTKQIQHRELLVVQSEPAGIIFLNSNDPFWKIKSRIMRLTNDGTFIHSSCECNGPWVENERITTAARKRQIDREEWLKVYDSLENHVFQNHFEVPQHNCFN